MTTVLDCLVIGGGPAGLTAAIYFGRFRRSVLVVDKGWSRAKWIMLSHNLPGFPDGMSGPALLERMRDQARRYGAVLEHGTIETLRSDANGLFIADVGGTSLSAQTVVLAAGVVENNPPLPHVAEAVKSGLIRTCPICDGYEAIGKTIAVLGNSEHAAAIAMDASGVTAVSVGDGALHRYDAVYSAFGIVPQTMRGVAEGAKVDAANRLFVDEHQETCVRGLFAAGDLVRGHNQIAVADGEAAIAATAIHSRLSRTMA